MWQWQSPEEQADLQWQPPPSTGVARTDTGEQVAVSEDQPGKAGTPWLSANAKKMMCTAGESGDKVKMEYRKKIQAHNTGTMLGRLKLSLSWN